MKKMILILAIASLGFAGCKKEVVRPQTNECRIIATKTTDGSGNLFFNYTNGEKESVYSTTYNSYNVGATYCQRPSQRP
ncbi:MAG: hypothetical protein EOO47_00115 [Flavobacterium sp.]|nr:MAG: hypothetical protein EOO47_00115 [Flavobacterium sp.]